MQSVQEPQHRGGSVEADGVADAGVLGRVGAQHDRQATLGRRDVAQSGVRVGDAGDATAPFRVSDVDGQPVVVDLLETEGRADEAAVELGDGDLRGGVERGQAVVVGEPGLVGRGRREGLDDGDVQVGQRAGVPGVVVATGLGIRGNRAAGGQHGGDDGVGLCERRK